MSLWVWIAIAVAAGIALVAVIAAFTISARRRSKSERLREQFGPEYAHVAHTSPSVREAEQELSDREERTRHLDLRQLSPDARERYAARWRDVQGRFVDDPHGAVRDADRLVQQVLTERGYSDDDFEHRVADISVEHPHLAASYRSAHETFARNDDGSATTEQLRYAMVDYRALFDEFLSDEVPVAR